MKEIFTKKSHATKMKLLGAWEPARRGNEFRE